MANSIPARWAITCPEQVQHALTTFSMLNQIIRPFGSDTEQNDLTKHQERKHPFKLQRINATAKRDSLLRLATTRREELDGFAEGLFGSHDDIDLPKRASDSVEQIGDLRALFFNTERMLSDKTISSTTNELVDLKKSYTELSKTAEKELHAAMISCAQTRQRQLMQ